MINLNLRNAAVAFTFVAAVTVNGSSPAFGQSYNSSYGNGYGGQQIIMDNPPPAQMNAIPSYKYDPNLDPKNLPVPPQSLPQITNLNTPSGFDMALQISDYNYQEPSLSVRLVGPKLGLDATMTGKLSPEWFISGNVRGAFGWSDYTGSGKEDSNFEDLFDVRGLVGRDFIARTFSASPYLGVGYRYLYSDDRGTSSTGASGYRRENELLYIPVGLQTRFAVMEGARIAPNAEFDYVAMGWQTSDLSDANVGLPNITNRQKSGYGLRGNLMWETNNWAAGPFVNYWSIQQSNTACATGPAYGLCGYEPTNHTVEAGLQFRYHFF